jgi:seryl-tRNA synthetase
MPAPGAKAIKMEDLALEPDIPRRTIREDHLILQERYNLFTKEVNRRFDDIIAKQDEARQKIQALDDRVKRIEAVHDRLTNAFS